MNSTLKAVPNVKKPNEKFVGTKRVLDIHRGKNNKVVEIAYQGHYSRAEIKKHTQDLSNEMKQKGFAGKIEVSLQYKDFWRSGYFSKVGDEVRIYEHHDSDNSITEEQTHFEEFRIYVLKDMPKAGGCTDPKNDCLYNCLKLVLLDKIPWESPSRFKQFLKIPSNMPVSINLIPQIEQKLSHYMINVKGDHVYTSRKGCIMEINLLLEDGHYTLERSNSLTNNYFNKKEKIPVIWENNMDDVKLYDGTNHFTMEYKKFVSERRHFIVSPYVFIPRDKKLSFEVFLR